ncbi:MAG: hypothetical protein K2P39_00535 [Lachnospiraceae bacterium]|nr:hypothetical protein [Lachnospiraceae bacterium]
MKLKYMLRGLGIGVVVTAAVMGAHNRNAVADARVAVLKEYGIGEEARLVGETEPSGEMASEELPEVTVTESVSARDEEKESELNAALDAAKADEQGGMTEPGEMQLPEEGSGDAESGVEPSEPGSVIVVTPSGEGDSVEIVIVSGDDSGTVARKLYNAGVIENASEYDAFLMQHGYDKRLTTGTKTIDAADSWQEIAEKITQ